MRETIPLISINISSYFIIESGVLQRFLLGGLLFPSQHLLTCLPPSVLIRSGHDIPLRSMIASLPVGVFCSAMRRNPSRS